MRTALPAPTTLAYLWAGISIGGPFLAVPAKFQVETLPLELALQIGQTQFRWIGTAEFILCVILISVLLLGGVRKNYLYALPVLLFFTQYSIIFPLLDARTASIIPGQAQEPSSLHLIFVGFEVAKTLSLVTVAALSKPVATYINDYEGRRSGISMDQKVHAEKPVSPETAKDHKQGRGHAQIN